uniref:Coiled-coil domain-containing protein 102A-like n=1 Tax=Globodera pallida TaxID=36090 RepID=A0A183CKS9_GLOPA
MRDKSSPKPNEHIGKGDGQQRRLESLSPTFVRTGLTHCQHTDWDLLREVRVRELTEVRQRVTLMENTMRWWLSAAEQWREKWLKVKNERSRLREENLRLRKALSNAKVELHGLKSSDGSIIGRSPKGICCAETRCRPSPSPPKTVVVIPPMCEKIVNKENTDCTNSSSSNSSKRRRRRSSSV